VHTHRAALFSTRLASELAAPYHRDMRIALCSDEPYPVHQTVRAWLQERGHEVVAFGSVKSGGEVAWSNAAEEAALAVASGDCAQGIFFCWTGTGISIAANKVPGIRAALCSDPGQTTGARIWNHANVLCLSNRTLSDDMAKEILRAWFDTEPGEQGAAGVALLRQVEARHQR
jgi:ribose 5-phosphate isomerase B